MSVALTSPPLELAAIASALDACGGLACHFDVDLLAVCDSSNTRLLARAEAGAPSGTVIVARQQTAGRGRRGRHWISSADDSLTFSLLWRFPPAVALEGLSLAVGLALARALEQMGGTGLTLKWPNDVLFEGRKLAGILIELSSTHARGSERRLAAIIGIGLNLRLPLDPAGLLDQPVAAWAQALPAATDPNPLLACLLAELHRQFDGIRRAGVCTAACRLAASQCPRKPVGDGAGRFCRTRQRPVSRSGGRWRAAAGNGSRCATLSEW